ncbi:hypothetical protein [Microbispora sp. NPDC049125]|uniref:hypothetical protein n=1 Tax=Microbispora sp. NPDC049125 TaxID=3154929 RepID=UPI0034674209
MSELHGDWRVTPEPQAPPSYEHIERTAADTPPFSNSTEGDAWTGRWCDTCKHDRTGRGGKHGPGCPLLLYAYLGKTPAEWKPTGEGELSLRYDCKHYLADPETGVAEGTRPRSRQC